MTDVDVATARAVSPSRSALGRPRTVLIFAYECAPYNRKESTVGAQRPAQFAKYLPEFGWRAIVICCDVAKRDRGWTAADRDAVASAVRDSDPSASLVIATPSLPWDGLLDRAWRSVSRWNGAPGAALVRKPLTFARFFTGDYSRSWQPCAREAAEIVAREVPVDACIGEHSPDAGIFLARWYSARYGVPWVADFRDPMLFGYPPRVRPVLEPFARRMLRTAAHVVNVNAHLARLDEALFGRPATIIPNGFDPDDFAGPAPARSQDTFRIVYVGSVWPPGGMPIFLDGLSRLRVRIGESHFQRVRFVYRGNAADRIAELASRAGVADVVDCAAHIPRQDAIALVRSAHVLLVLSATEAERRDRYWEKGVCPGKVFEYIAAQRPIICVPGDGAQLDALLAESRAGTPLADAHAVARHLEATLAAWEAARDLQSCANGDVVARYSRRAGAQTLAAILDTVAGRSAPAATSGRSGLTRERVGA